MCAMLGTWAVVATAAALWAYREPLRALVARLRGGG